ncbi:Cytochrome b5, variant 2 [Entomophthora muscae]|uniref:Cytochrome b5, variant 2 n=2 Tax=Entomophthora muscae TaxID=34485 RepID=A0ACC2TLA6_9FUNG|nr:Cytochrome b5 [Entomophthora muscae]KAJ9075267.1 Cytochrome b5, variant 2 [Entomophthora muscae]
MSKIFSFDEVSSHKTSDSLWMIIEGSVYDITKFISDHPGGEEVLLELGGLDGTEAFEDIGHSDGAREMLKEYLIGKVDPDSKPQKKTTYEPLPSKEKSKDAGQGSSCLIL